VSLGINGLLKSNVEYEPLFYSCLAKEDYPKEKFGAEDAIFTYGIQYSHRHLTVSSEPF